MDNSKYIVMGHRCSGGRGTLSLDDASFAAMLASLNPNEGSVWVVRVVAKSAPDLTIALA